MKIDGTEELESRRGKTQVNGLRREPGAPSYA